MYSEEDFWEWFIKHEAAYRHLDEIENTDAYEELLETLLAQLHKYSPGIYFLVGQADEMELIITAEGNPDFFEPVKKIVAAAPEITGWRFIAFKPAASEPFFTNYQGAVIETSNSWFRYFESSNPGERRGSICIYSNNYRASDRDNFLAAGYTVLDSLLGEKLNASLINYVDVQAIPESSAYPDLLPLAELKRYLERLQE